jgi:hypothetical protein
MTSVCRSVRQSPDCRISSRKVAPHTLGECDPDHTQGNYLTPFPGFPGAAIVQWAEHREALLCRDARRDGLRSATLLRTAPLSTNILDSAYAALATPTVSRGPIVARAASICSSFEAWRRSSMRLTCGKCQRRLDRVFRAQQSPPGYRLR